MKRRREILILLTLRTTIGLVLSLAIPLIAQDATPPVSAPAPERWNLYYQATSIGDYHGTFNAPYTGPLSLQDYPERDVSLTTTLFFGLRLEDNTFLYFDPEIAGGKGFSGVNGFANPPNGEIPRVASAEPKPYIARLYIQHDFALGHEKEKVESDENQLAGERPVNRYTVYAGRFTITDFFDDNNYSHDPFRQTFQSKHSYDDPVRQTLGGWAIGNQRAGKGWLQDRDGASSDWL